MSKEYAPRDAFLDFHNRKQRWAVLCTHRRAGKTVALVNDCIVGALECPLERPQLAYVGPTYRQAKRIAWQYMKDYGERYFSKPPAESELKITLHGDRTIYCLGADNPDSLRGMYLDGGVGDEYALFRPSVFSQVIRPALSDRNGWWVFASTPRGKNLFHTEYKRGLSLPSKYFTMLLRASSSGIIGKEELADLREDMDPEEYAQEYECSFDSALKGAIYADEINSVFYEGRVQHGLLDPALKVNVVFDLGFTDATVMVFWQEDLQGNIRIVKVYAASGKDILHYIGILYELGDGLGDVWLPHDARAKNLQTKKSIVEQFLIEGIRPNIVPDHKVKDRISATRRVFPLMYFEEEETEDLIEALKGYHREWDDKLLIFDDKPKHDWCSDYADAFGYMAVVCKRRKPQTSQDIEVEKRLGYSLDELYLDNADRVIKNRRIA